jgi:hypothetical protein
VVFLKKINISTFIAVQRLVKEQDIIRKKKTRSSVKPRKIPNKLNIY